MSDNKTKIFDINHKENVEQLLEQLEELTNKESLHFDQDVFDEKEEIKEKILKGEIRLS